LTDDGEQTGWSRDRTQKYSYVEMAQRNLIARGVPLKTSKLSSPSVRERFTKRSCSRKSAAGKLENRFTGYFAYHTRRTLWTFERVFETENVEFGIVSPPTGEQTPPPNVWWLAPRGWSFVAGEYVKSVYYWLYY
jgi:hypothetical protein